MVLKCHRKVKHIKLLFLVCYYYYFFFFFFFTRRLLLSDISNYSTKIGHIFWLCLVRRSTCIWRLWQNCITRRSKDFTTRFIKMWQCEECTVDRTTELQVENPLANDFKFIHAISRILCWSGSICDWSLSIFNQHCWMPTLQAILYYNLLTKLQKKRRC